MRAVVLSSLYIDPVTRGKLRALAGLNCAVCVGVPDRWTPLGHSVQLRATWEEDGGVQIAPIPVRRSRGAVVWSRSAIRRLITDFSPHIVHIEDEPWTSVAAAATATARRLDIPSVLFVANSVSRPLPLLDRWRRSRTLKRVSGVIASNRIAAALVSTRRATFPLAVLPQVGVNPPVLTPRTDHRGFSIGFIGRLVSERGLDLLLNACSKLIGVWRLTVVGSGPEQERLERLTERLGIAARVAWLGGLPHEELVLVWPGLDCVVMPARTTPRWVEGVGRILIEAMGHGIAVVGTDSGVIPEVIGSAGIVVPQDDAPALKLALQRLIDSPTQRTAFGAEGRRRALADYVDDAVARRTLEFWRGVARRVASP